jgi:MFS family permease
LADTVPRHDPYAALRIPNFRWFIVSAFTQTIATQIQTIVVGWQVYQQTHDALSLGLVGLAEALPYVAVALYAGHIADLGGRRRVAVISSIGMLLCAAALFVYTMHPDVLAHGRVWPIYIVIFLSGIARSFVRPASSALAAELVERELFPNAVAWRTSVWQFAAVVGPAVGGVLYGFAGPRLAYGVVVVLMVISTVALLFIAHQERLPEASTMPIGESLKVGVRFVFQQPVVLAAMTLDLFSVLFGGATALLPIFAADILHVGTEGLGILRAAPAIGSVVIGLYIAHRPPFRHAGKTLLIAVAFFGVCMIGFGLSHSFYLSLALLTLSGAADNISVVIRSTLVQSVTPDHLFGRVAAVNQIFIGSSNQIGEFESGVAAKLLGAAPSVIVGGVMTLVVVGLAAWHWPQLRTLREIKELAV